MIRLGHAAEQVTRCDAREPAAFIALENLGSRTGAMVPGLEIPTREPDPAGMVSFQPGDVLFGKLRPYLAKSWLADREGLCSSELIALRARAGVDPRWLAYLAQSDLLVEWAVATSEGVKMPRTSWEKLRQLQVLVPRLPLQRALVDYLDAETARINALVSARRRQADLVVERFRIVREDRLRLVLEDYGTVPLKRLAWRIEQGWSPDAEAVSAEPSEWGVLKTSAVSTGQFDGAENKKLPEGVAVDKRWVVRDGDLLVVRGSGSPGAVAQAAVATTDGRHLLLPDLLYRVVLREGDARYIAEALASQSARDQFEAAIRTDVGMTRKIRSDDLSNVLLPAAPPSVQREVSQAIEADRLHAERVRCAAGRQIDLLLERRQALITAAVTGQLEIPGVAA